jgi:argininosuccinate synthase
MLRWIKENYKCHLTAFIADVGQNEDFESIKAKAYLTGADDVHIVDLKKEFVEEFIFTAIKANAVYESGYLMGTSLARPLIARSLVDFSLSIGADTIAHGATHKGNDQVRFELVIKTFAPGIKILAPWRIWKFRSRVDLIEYARRNKIPVSADVDRPYSIDENLMHISYEGGILEDPWFEPPEDIFKWTVSPEKAPDEPEYIEIEFEKGIPVALNGEMKNPVELVQSLNKIGSRHAIGRVDIVENRFIGIKSRGVYETPGVTLLHIAHRAVESLTLDREVMHMKDSLVPKFAELIYNGLWFSPEMETLKTLIDKTQESVTGTARLKLYKGNAILVGRKSPLSLYEKDLSSFDNALSIRPCDSEGFINICSLRLTAYAKVKKQNVNT